MVPVFLIRNNSITKLATDRGIGLVDVHVCEWLRKTIEPDIYLQLEPKPSGAIGATTPQMRRLLQDFARLRNTWQFNHQSEATLSIDLYYVSRLAREVLLTK